uniref:Putative site-specific DNA endonuclease n=1 Tax=Tupiella akineta TaxID=160070 RepID=Q3ZJ56_TUPAK|nr:putative site-specific DNA endonuclease [Tupiella akineta]AAV80635.1 putative site-specific DNA endonuclease [Tupiella akineta]
MANTSLIYEQYIFYLRTKPQESNVKLEKHRIVPKHAGGTYEESNVLYITFKEHTLAHFYRYLTFKQKGDLIAYRFMCRQTEEGRLLLASYAGKIGGTKTNEKDKETRKKFYNPEWQKKFGDKNGDRRNVESGSLERLNIKITAKTPKFRSKAGKLGGKAISEKHKRDEFGMFDKKKRIQRKGNLVRWGILINKKRIPYKNLSSDFIDYYIEYGNPFA